MLLNIVFVLFLFLCNRRLVGLYGGNIYLGGRLFGKDFGNLYLFAARLGLIFGIEITARIGFGPVIGSGLAIFRTAV